ncbi:MAG: glycosyltransferase family 9 protein [Chlorobia bacterium]|nr:glycosyltransferase family 9 protein [Fimbriimonadaceae bacterium]
MAERFLISRLSSLGDVACSLPAAGALKRAFPESEIVWAVDPRFAGVARSCRHIDEVIEVKPSLKPDSWPVIEGEFDAALDLQGLLKSGLVLKGAKAKTKVGYHWQREGAWLFSERVIPDSSSIHIVDQYVDVARAVGGKADRADFGLAATDEAMATVKPKLGSEEPFVVMNGGAGWVTKRWPTDRFSKLIDLLAAQEIRSVLIGGPTQDDKNVGAEIARQSKTKPQILIGETSITELVALLSLAKAHVGGDTGSSHLAAGLGIPAVGLYSITKPTRSCPYGQIERCQYDARGLGYIEPDLVFRTLMESIKA